MRQKQNHSMKTVHTGNMHTHSNTGTCRHVDTHAHGLLKVFLISRQKSELWPGPRNLSRRRPPRRRSPSFYYSSKNGVDGKKNKRPNRIPP